LNRDSIAQLVEEQYPSLLWLLRRKLHDPQLAADVLNEAFATALEHLQAGRIEDPSLLAGYVFQVALNHERNHRRKFDERHDHRVDSDTLDQMPARSSASDADLDTRLMGHVRQVVLELTTERDREIVKRFYLDEEDKDVICRDLGLLPLHFDKVVFRARQRLRALLERKGYVKPDLFAMLLGVIFIADRVR
jgi:RNA polymerase sigma-70 factor (ECF subfamily)